jgi:DNA mismatch repair protein MutL
MGIVRRMDEALANRIAAGEVVERPANVLKELVENSLDAGAKSINVSMRGAGVEELVVEDDGGGMDPEDALACFQRHATSKLTQDSDLFRIATMGFRGEALASISSVAKVVLQTGQGAGLGHEVVMVPGQPVQQRSISRAQGTRISVSDLFFNTPARRQFLKTDRGEAAAAKSWLTRLAMANPDVAFSLRDEKSERLRVAAVGPTYSEKDRLAELMGKGISGGLYLFEGEREGYSLRAFAARPDLSRRDRRGLMIFINNRFVDDRRLQQAVVEGFRSVLEVGRHPVAVVFLKVPPGLVDVNVHPQKTEVRLAQPRLAFSVIRGTIADGLIDAPWLEINLPAQVGVAENPPTGALWQKTPLQAQRLPSSSVFSSGGGGNSSLRNLASSLPPAPSAGRVHLGGAFRDLPEPGLLKGVSYGDLRAVGQVALTYLLLEGPQGLVIIDQHAAHERIVFGRLQRALAGEHLPQQGLLLPQELVLDAEELAELLAHRDLAERFGFVLQEEGDRIWVKSVPALLGKANPERLLADLAGALVEGSGEAELERAFDAVIARLACHGSIRAGQRLSNDEISALMLDLDEAEHRSHCPHGRPFVVHFGEEVLETWFHRD